MSENKSEKKEKVFCEECKFCCCHSTYCFAGLFGDKIKTGEKWICKAPETEKIKTHENYLHRYEEKIYQECQDINANNDCKFFILIEKQKKKSWFSRILSQFKK